VIRKYPENLDVLRKQHRPIRFRDPDRCVGRIHLLVQPFVARPAHHGQVCLVVLVQAFRVPLNVMDVQFCEAAFLRAAPPARLTLERVLVEHCLADRWRHRFVARRVILVLLVGIHVRRWSVGTVVVCVS
jgi:hypothetical protein